MTSQEAAVTLTTHEHRISLAEAARRQGKVPSTAWRWPIGGVLRRGQRIHLGAKRVGGRWETTVEALDRFERALNNDRLPPITASPSARHSAATATARELKEASI